MMNHVEAPSSTLATGRGEAPATTLVDSYFSGLADLLARIHDEQRPAIMRAGRLVAEAVDSDHMVHLFGTGHSHLLAEEGLYRAGGLAAVNAMLVPDLMLHQGAIESGQRERMPGRAVQIADEYELARGDVLLVFSNSGINAVPVELARYAAGLGVHVIAVTSVTYARQAAARQAAAQRSVTTTADGRTPTTTADGCTLCAAAEIVIDTGLPSGDALVALPGGAARMGPASTVVGATILNAILLAAAQELLERGHEVPVYVSSNMPGAAAHNALLRDRFRGRVRHL